MPILFAYFLVFPPQPGTVADRFLQKTGTIGFQGNINTTRAHFLVLFLFQGLLYAFSYSNFNPNYDNNYSFYFLSAHSVHLYFGCICIFSEFALHCIIIYSSFSVLIHIYINYFCIIIVFLFLRLLYLQYICIFNTFNFWWFKK